MKLVLKKLYYYLRFKYLEGRKLIKILSELTLLQVCLGVMLGCIAGTTLEGFGLVIIVITFILLRKSFIAFNIAALVVIVVCVSGGFNLRSIFSYELQTMRLDAKVIEEVVERDFGDSAVVQIGDKKFILQLPKYSGYQVDDILKVEVSKVEGLENLDAGYAVYLASRGVYGNISSVHVELIENSKSLSGSMNGLKNTLGDIIRHNLLPPESDLLEGIILGEKASLSSEFKQDLQVSGLMHVVAVSGFNVMLIANFLMVFCGFIPRRFVYLFTLIIIWLFLFLVGVENLPAQRAVIMLTVMYLGLLIGRRIPMLLCLIYASALMLITNPLMWLNISWQLSFGAMIGVIIFSNILNKFLNSKSDIGANLVSTVAVILTTGPISFVSFGSFSLVGLLSNLLIVPVVPIITMIGIVSLGISGIPELANFLFQLVELILKIVVQIIGFLGNFAEGVVTTPLIAVTILGLIFGIILMADFKIFVRSVENKNAEV